MSMTLQDLTEHVTQECPKGVGIFITLTAETQDVEVLDSRNRQIATATFHVEQGRDLEATVLDALSHARAEVRN